jgi:hypothetical protein
MDKISTFKLLVRDGTVKEELVNLLSLDEGYAPVKTHKNRIRKNSKNMYDYAFKTEVCCTYGKTHEHQEIKKGCND